MVNAIIPAASQIGDLITDQIPKTPCLQSVVKTLGYDMPPEPYFLYAKEWDNMNFDVQIDHYMPDMCVSITTFEVDASGFATMLEELPQDVLDMMQPMFEEVIASVEKEVVEPINKSIMAIEKAIRKGPKKIFDSVESKVKVLKKFLSKARSSSLLSQGLVRPLGVGEGDQTRVAQQQKSRRAGLRKARLARRMRQPLKAAFSKTMTPSAAQVPLSSYLTYPTYLTYV